MCQYWTFILTLTGAKKQQPFLPVCPLPPTSLLCLGLGPGATPTVALHSDCLVYSHYQLGASWHLEKPLQPHFPLVFTSTLCLTCKEPNAEFQGESHTLHFWVFAHSGHSSWDAFPHFLLLADPAWSWYRRSCPWHQSLSAWLCYVPCCWAPFTALCSLVIALSTLCGNCWVTCLFPP